MIRQLSIKLSYSALLSLLILGSLFIFTSEDKNTPNIQNPILLGSSILERGPLSIDNMGFGDYTWEQAKTYLSPYCTGLGTAEHPYILENLSINAHQAQYGLRISNSTVHFIVRNCIFYNSTNISPSAGLWLENVTNGNISEIISNDNGYSGLYMNYCSKIRVENSEFDYQTYGIFSFLSCINNEFVNNQFTNSNTGIGFWQNNRFNSITNNIFKNCSDYSIWLQKSYDNTISNNYITNPAPWYDTAIYMIESCDNLIENNIIHNNTNGIYFMTKSARNTIRNNIFTNQTTNSIDIRAGCDNNDIINNTFVNNSGSAIVFTQASGSLISSNRITNNTGNGMYFITKCDANTISNNNISFCTMNGIQITDQSMSNQISNNKIFNVSIGITLSDSENSQVIHNIVFNAYIGVTGAGDSCNFSSNDIYNTTYGVQIYGSTTTFKRNCVENSTYGVFMGSATQYSNCEFNYLSNNDNGFYLVDADRCSFFNNKIEGSNVGLYISSSSASNYIFSNYFFDNINHVEDHGTDTTYNYDIGNYYDNYTGIDFNSDGIGDTSVAINGGGIYDFKPIWDTTIPTFIVAPIDLSMNQEDTTETLTWIIEDHFILSI